MKRLSDIAVVLAVRLVMALIHVLPVTACEHLARWLATLATDVFRIRHALIDENLRHAFPDMTDEQRRTTTWKMWEHLALLVCEMVLAPRKIHETNWRKFVRMNDTCRMSSYLLDPRPVVFVSGHYSNFELGSLVMGLFGFPSYAVARTMDNPYLDRLIRAFRESRGQFILPKDGSATVIQRVLESGQILMLLGDQHAGTKGVWIDFLGRPASCHKALALFTLGSGAPMLVTYCRRTSGMFRFDVGLAGIADPQTMAPSLNNVTALTQWYNDRLAEIIRQEPSQYWWVHRRWKEKPVRKRGAQPAAA
jgi:KDO2-lipid IV(A) lauroyltransferase